MSVFNGEEEAMLYYLYMMSDGEVSFNEAMIFNAICKELEIDNATKDRLIAKCEKLAEGGKDPFRVILRERIDAKAEQDWIGRKDESSLARIIWNLVNLGYADSFFSDEEKKIVNHCKARWSIDPEVYQELIDTADTMLALAKQKEWIAATFSESSTREEKEKSIDAEIMGLLDDVKLLLEELAL